MVTKKIEKNVDEIVADQPIQRVSPTGEDEPEFSNAKEIFERALQHQTKGDYRQAIDLYSSSVTIYPELYEPYYNIALCCEKLHQSSDAIKYFEKAASLNRFYKPIFFHLGKLYSEKSDEAKSATSWAIYYQM